MANLEAIDVDVTSTSIALVLTQQLPPAIRFNRVMQRNVLTVDPEVSGRGISPKMLTSSTSRTYYPISNVVPSEYRRLYKKLFKRTLIW